MLALWLMSLTNDELVLSTYYLFRKKLVGYLKEHGIDLMKERQSRITGGQALEFGVEGKLLGSNKVRGYSINETETCDVAGEDGKPVLNLLSDTEVKEVSAPNAFLKLALENTQEIITGMTEKVYADGTYHNTDNLKYCQSEGIDIDLVLTAMQGVTLRNDVRLDGQDESNLIVTDNKTGETVQSYPVNTLDKKRKRNQFLSFYNLSQSIFDINTNS